MKLDEIVNEAENDFDEPAPFRRQRSSIAISSIRILTEDEINRAKVKLYEDMEQAYMEAIRAHVSIFLYTLTEEI